MARGLKESHRYCVSPQNLMEFCSVVTRGKFVNPPMSAKEAARMGQILYRSRRLSKVYPKRGTVERTLELGRALGQTGTIWYDMYLACTMRDSGIRSIITENTSDFRRFPFVEVRKILEAVQ